ncbi:hypothetical protein AN964_14025 [Heyndrickxia shackletonii]|uniref:Uncharacterized protein n=1 Tax=Heyndrickxia shackletonii TaxID=157838 RepID=A0A0Q3WYR0_9BACI|nr:hypothetical protein [Heyndrickxia shackletonii]KQL54506.1 hypothetical protein AN964_14025 [Heyndrickxia shackletonii]NEY99235.1 hypothetical protein [Heyndrickxia shackletonii]
MAYAKTDWKNRVVERPRTFKFQQNADASVTLIPDEGQIIEPGTPVNAENMNKIEQGVADFYEHKADYVSHPANGGTTSGTSTAYTCNSSPNPTELVDKIGIVITAHVDSGSNPTIKWGSLAAKSIKKPNGNAANLKKDGLYTLRYNSVNDSFILQGEGASGNATASDLLSGKTASTDAGDITGTLTLTGTASDADVLTGKTYYNTDAKNIRTGTLTPGKKFASGSITGSSTTIGFKENTGSTGNYLYIAVNGLNFKPSRIIIRKTDDPSFECIYDDGEVNADYKIKMIYTFNNTRYFKVDGTSAYITNTSFRLPVTNATLNGSFTWDAYE